MRDDLRAIMQGPAPRIHQPKCMNWWDFYQSCEVLMSRENLTELTLAVEAQHDCSASLIGTEVVSETLENQPVCATSRRRKKSSYYVCSKAHEKIFNYFFLRPLFYPAVREKPKPNVRPDYRVVNLRQGGGGAGLRAERGRTLLQRANAP
jgi:hypothetical protein